MHPEEKFLQKNKTKKSKKNKTKINAEENKQKISAPAFTLVAGRTTYYVFTVLMKPVAEAASKFYIGSKNKKKFMTREKKEKPLGFLFLIPVTRETKQKKNFSLMCL